MPAKLSVGERLLRGLAVMFLFTVGAALAMALTFGAISLGRFLLSGLLADIWITEGVLAILFAAVAFYLGFTTSSTEPK